MDPTFVSVPLVTVSVAPALNPSFVSSIVPALVNPLATVSAELPTPPMRNSPPDKTLNAPFTTVFSR